MVICIKIEIKRYPEILYTFVVWPTIANVFKISEYLFIMNCPYLGKSGSLTIVLNLY